MAWHGWRVWGVSVAIAGGLTAADKPADLPTRSEPQGRSTPAITQEHFQPESATPPRLLPNPVLREAPIEKGPTAAVEPANLVGSQMPNVLTDDLDVPIRILSFGKRIGPAEVGGLPQDWKARTALDIAELHFHDCDREEARRWYREVVRLAPGSRLAAVAADRLKQTEVIPAGALESPEPPLAGTLPVETASRIR